MWTGSDWIPVPPGTTQNASINLQDSVVTGDVIINNNVEATLPTNICRICNKEGIFDVMTCSQCNERQCEDCTENKRNVFTCRICVEAPAKARLAEQNAKRRQAYIERLRQYHRDAKSKKQKKKESKLKQKLAKQRESNMPMSNLRFEVRLLESYMADKSESVEVLATDFRDAGRVALSKYPNAVVIGIDAIF